MERFVHFQMDSLFKDTKKQKVESKYVSQLSTWLSVVWVDYLQWG